MILMFQCEESDSTSPTISIISPLDSSLVSDTVSVIILAEDDIGVASVELYLDESILKTIDSMPWSFDWITTEYADDQHHQLYAKAYDEAGNVGISDTLTLMIISPLQPIVSLTPTNLEFGDLLNELPLIIMNIGADTLEWSISGTLPWMEIYPISGSTSSETDTVIISVNRDVLELGVYAGEVEFNSESGNRTIPVSMTVSETPVLWVSEQNLVFTPGVSVIPLNLINTGVGTLQWTISSDEGWLQAEPNDGSTEAETDIVSVYVYRGNLADGTYEGQLHVISNGGELEISVSMAVEHTGTGEPNSVEVISEPSGASIYIDGTNVNMITPATITSLTARVHQIRLFLPGYNEYIAHLVHEMDQSHLLNVVLDEPGFPLPLVTISNPGEGAQFADNVIQISGSMTLQDSSGGMFPYIGEHAILSINNYDQDISVFDGTFQQAVSITSGENTIQVRANSAEGNTGLSEVVTCVGTFPAPDIEVTLTWNTPTSDLDLHLWTPLGEHCYYGDMHTTEGFLDIDDVEGYGPETYTAESAFLGGYVLMVNNYYLDQDAFADATIQLRLNGSPVNVFGPHSFIIDDGNGNNPEAWWEVVAFYPNAGSSSNQRPPLSEQMKQKILSDMQKLPAKY